MGIRTCERRALRQHQITLDLLAHCTVANTPASYQVGATPDRHAQQHASPSDCDRSAPPRSALSAKSEQSGVHTTGFTAPPPAAGERIAWLRAHGRRSERCAVGADNSRGAAESLTSFRCCVGIASGRLFSAP